MKKFAFGCLGLLLLAALIVGGYFGINWLNQRDQTTPASEETAPLFIQETATRDLKTKESPPGAVPTDASSATPVKSTIPPSSTGSAEEGGDIPPPPNSEQMSPIPTNTGSPTLSPTHTVTQTESSP